MGFVGNLVFSVAVKKICKSIKNEGRYSVMAPMVVAVSNAVAKDALCVNDMECGGKCVIFTLTVAERWLQNILNIR